MQTAKGNHILARVLNFVEMIPIRLTLFEASCQIRIFFLATFISNCLSGNVGYFLHDVTDGMNFQLILR